MNELNKYERPSNFVAPLRCDVLPPVRHIPQVIDPYAPSMPAVQQVTKFEATPITRAWGMAIKISQVTIALAILTAAALYEFSEFYLVTWIILASLEWVAVFIVMAIIDYRETPAAQNRMQWHDYAKMMDREQRNRLRAMYGKDYVE